MQKIIILTDPNHDEVYLPLEENLQRGKYNSFQELKTDWENISWGFHYKVKARYFLYPKTSRRTKKATYIIP